MDKKDLYDTILNLENQANDLADQLAGIKEEVSEMTQENHTLRMENQYLRDRLDSELSQKNPDSQVSDQVPPADPNNPSGLTKSRLNLENIYEDGFHVCNLFFGKRREGDSPCAFCLEVIYGDRDQKQD